MSPNPSILANAMANSGFASFAPVGPAPYPRPTGGTLSPTPPGFGGREGFTPPISPFASMSGLGGNPAMAGGIGGASNLEMNNLKSVMKNITSELQKLAKVIQDVNKAASGTGPGGVGMGGVSGAGVGAGTGTRFRDPLTGRTMTAAEAQGGLQRVFGQAAMMRGVSGVTPMSSLGGTGITGLPSAPLPFYLQAASGGQGGGSNQLSVLAQSANPVIARAAQATQGIHPSARYINPAITDGVGANYANTFKQQTLAAAAQQQMLDQPGGYYGPGGRGFFQNFARGLINRPGQMGERVNIPSVDQIMTDLNMPNTRENRASAERYKQELSSINQGVATNESQVATGRTVGRGIAYAAKTALGISGTSVSQLAGSIPFVGGLIAAPFQVAEGLAGQFGNEYSAAVARGAQGLGVGTGRANIESLYGLRQFGITPEQATSFGTEYGGITGRAFGANQVGLMARGLTASQVGQLEMMNVMGVGFNARGTGNFGLRAMGAAQGMGIQGAQSQFNFAQALSNAGQGLLGQGAIVDVNRFMGGVRGVAAGGRVTGTDAIGFQAYGQSAVQSASKGFLSSMFGDLDQTLTFSRLITQSGGDIYKAALAGEQETPQERIKRNIDQFGQAGLFGAMTTFGATATQEFRRGAKRGGLGKAVEGIDITGGTVASSRVLGEQMKGVGTAYDNQDKILQVLSANQELQKKLMQAVTPEFIDGVSTSLTTIAEMSTKLLSTVIGFIAGQAGVSLPASGSAQPSTPLKLPTPTSNARAYGRGRLQ